MKVTLITCHTPFSRRKAGFHWLADAFFRRGWKVTFVTAYTLIDYLKRDYRREILKHAEFNTEIQVAQNFKNYIAFRWWRPFNTKNKHLNQMTARLFKRYGNWKRDSFHKAISNSDIFVFESLYDLLYFPEVKKRNPDANFVYRVSDDLTTFNVHPFMIEAEENLSSHFDLVSVPNEAIFERFKRFCHPVLQPHGIPKYLFDRASTNPYCGTNKNAIFVGSTLFDSDFLEQSSAAFPNVTFHIIGPIKRTVKSDNVVYYGEMPYEETISYIKHADIALSPVKGRGLMESNKIMQYRYCKLPIIISEMNRIEDDSIFYYSPGKKESIVEAVHSALEYGNQTRSDRHVADWDDLISVFIKQER